MQMEEKSFGSISYSTTAIDSDSAKRRAADIILNIENAQGPYASSDAQHDDTPRFMLSPLFKEMNTGVQPEIFNL